MGTDVVFDEADDRRGSMAKTVSDLAREIILRLDRGEPLEQALSVALGSDLVDDEVRAELQVAGLRDAVGRR